MDEISISFVSSLLLKFTPYPEIMIRKIFGSAVVVLLLCSTLSAFAWGVWGHNHISKGAVLALPKEMGMFFYNHTDFLTTESTVPDLRKYTIGDKAEFCRHYINLEKYDYKGRGTVPKSLADVRSRYGKDSTDKWGILPWYIEEMMTKLTNAMKNKRKTEILFLAGDLAHYIADAHMPLHTTVESDGQSTGQRGIHSFWESQLPELFGKDYNLYSGEAHYIKDVDRATWDIIDSSYSLADRLLATEAKLRKDNPEDKQYDMGPDGKPKKNDFGVSVHQESYARIYHELLGGMVERQMRLSLQHVADYWYTAWVNAGKPDLSDLDPDYITSHNKSIYKDDVKAWKKGKVRGCKSDKDY